MTRRTLLWTALAPALVLASARCSSPREKPVPEPDAAPSAEAAAAADTAAELGGTSWRLVKFEGGDGTVLTPDDPSKYTLSFQPDGRVAPRIDCNRGLGSWNSSGPGHLEFGPLALTRAMCPPGSLHDQLVRQWPYVRSYVLRDGRLFLSLMADGGIYELEPTGGEERRGATPSDGTGYAD